MTAGQPIFSADPKAAYLAAKTEIDAAIQRVLASGRYILGPEVEAFEQEFAAYLGAANARDETRAVGAANARDETRAVGAGGCVGVANGTDALELALRALGIGPGDRVATVANSVTATAAAIAATGASPVFVEIEPATMLMDPAALERVLAADRGIKAVVPVHLYGQPCALPEIIAIARRHAAAVVEDCAQAHGAAVGGRKVGTWGDLAAFSFYPTKNLAALGDGGAVTGRDPVLLEKVRRLRQYGWRTRYVSEGPGRNSRLDELQAAILRVQLPRLDAANAHRARLAARYVELLGKARRPFDQAQAPSKAEGDGTLHLPVVAAGRTHVWHQFVVRTPQRDALKARLEQAGIHCGVLYPVPLHRQRGLWGNDYSILGKGGSGSVPATSDPIAENQLSLPETDRACAEVLSLPLHPGITEADVARVCGEIER